MVCLDKEAAMTTTAPLQEQTPSSTSDTASKLDAAPRVDVVDVNQMVEGHRTLHCVSFDVKPGEVLAIAGGSGAGKTTLLEAIAGIRPPSSGWILIDGEERGARGRSDSFGYVPQDDIIHTELPLRKTLEHSAALRLPATAGPGDIESAVDSTMERLDLTSRADVPVGSLSGGQRKRASIATELLTDPRLFFLDEPTSGLDPATGAEVMRQLRHLAEAGTTIVMTTHAPSDLLRCDRVVFLATDGHVAFVGAPADAIDYFGVANIAEVYEVLAAGDPKVIAHEFAASHLNARSDVAVAWPRVEHSALSQPKRSWLRQMRALTHRSVDVILRNKLTLAILIGSPASVVAMMATLFRPGTFDTEAFGALPAIQTLFWIAFASFFFGVTYGLLQVVGEFAIVRRERRAGISISAYVASKLAVLTPLVTIVNVVMLGVLRGLDRLPPNSASNWAMLAVTTILISLAALSMGLLASASVSNPAQATLALPMLCFPQVLFAGAVVPVSEMASVGRWMSFGLADRWGFEALARTMGLDTAAASSQDTSGYVPAFTGSVTTGWIVLGAIIAMSVIGTCRVLDRRTKPGAR